VSTTITATELAAELRRAATFIERESPEAASRIRERVLVLEATAPESMGWVCLAERGDSVAALVLDLSRTRA
jgi:hypothetical protein